ncbi:LacI family transcriptional regulator [Georgenia satyanarayanai]|uniref:LacI family DNA-binding transcriptional regulator n=1 Tax=Georgenia satyanarayanai TaxID=860221 RepID=UPI00203F3D5C|nr:LacI family DNA-binding transcriptional regulator [Georgenia satyanarayanai]MCM3660984.1 LacI family transcriptional regulator [Georgenia satyanarayanai]
MAREAGTTAATASYVLSGKEGRYISTDMRNRVMAAVATTGYIKSSPASSLHGKRQGIIAVLVPQFSNQYFTNLMVAIESVVEKQGLSLSISNTFDDPDRERDLVVKMVQQRVDGYILIPTTAGARSTDPIRKLRVPMVLVDRPLQGASGSFTEVFPDNYRAGYVLGEHLGQAGHTRVAYLGWDSGFEILDRRREGFWDGLAAATGKRQREVSVNGDFPADGGYRLAERVHREHPDVTAWCLGFNVPARGSVDYLRDQRIKVGEDLSVVMIGAPDWALVGANDFTLVDLRPEEMGRTAAERLLQELSGPQAAPARTTVDCLLHAGSSVMDIRNSH